MRNRRGSAKRGARLLGVLSSLGAAVMLVPVAWADFNGGGSAKSDCYVVYKGITVTSGKNKVECTDGDPACDTDGLCQGTCSFGFTACVNEPGIAGCTPSNVTAITVNGATLNTPALGSDAVCGGESIVGVPVKQGKKGPKRGKLKLKVKATSASKPKKDKDVIKFFCTPREGECPPQPTTTTTTTTIPGACCGLPSDSNTSASFLNFKTVAGTPGANCGSYQTSSLTNPIACGGLYFGGGGNAVPLPASVPDLGNAFSKIASCTGQVANLAAATQAETGSNRTCTEPGCFFGAPLAVPNVSTPPTSTCVLNQIGPGLSGTVNCQTGASDLTAPLASIIYLTGDGATDPMDAIPGIQPCPLCSAGSCVGGPNNGMACVAGTTALNEAYPTSHDCPPDPMFDIGTLPIAFSLTTGTVSWTGVTAANPSSTQTRVFAGFCRDPGSGAFLNPAQKCWENGMAVGAACSGTFSTCEQRSNGAFGPGGGAFSTITAIGTASAGLLTGPASGVLASVFAIPPTFNPTVDGAGDLPGPGAVALPGTAQLCADAMACP